MISYNYRAKLKDINAGESFPINYKHNSTKIGFYSLGPFGLFLLIVTLNIVISNYDKSGLIENIIVALFFGGFSLGALYLACVTNYSMHLKIDRDAVYFMKKYFLIGSKKWKESRSNYLGVEPEVSHHRSYHSRYAYSTFSINLIHKNNNEKDVPLYFSYQSNNFREQIEKFSRILETPVIKSSPDGTRIFRKHDELDQTITERINKCAVQANSTIDNLSTNELISINQEGDKKTIEIKIKLFQKQLLTISSIIILFILLLTIITGFGVSLIMPFLIAAIFFMIGFSMYYLKERIILLPDQIKHQILFKDMILYNNDINLNSIEEISYSATQVKLLELSGDNESHIIGASLYLNSNETETLRKTILKYISDKA